MGISAVCLRGDVLEFSSAIASIFGTSLKFPNFLRCKALVVWQLVGQLGKSIYGDSNLVLFQLWLREAKPKPEKVYLCFVQDCIFLKTPAEGLLRNTLTWYRKMELLVFLLMNTFRIYVSLLTKRFVFSGSTSKAQNIWTFKWMSLKRKLWMIFCSLIKRFVQMLLLSNLSLFRKENMSP